MKKNLSTPKRILATMLALGMLTPPCALADSFFVDTDNHWAKNTIDDATIQGYISGYSDSTFRPDNAVTRAEFCKMMNAAMTFSKSSTMTFSDVSRSDWYYSQVASAISAGYMNGYEDGTFLPNKEISRQEAAAVIARLIPSPNKLGNIDQFDDSEDIAPWAVNAVQIVTGAGYMRGDNKGNFRSADSLTRAEAVTLIQSVLHGENVKRGDFIISTGDQSFSNTIFTGPVYITLSDTQQAVFRNCQFLDTVVVQSADKVAFYDSQVPHVQVTDSAKMVELWAMGDTTVKNTSLATGSSLTESDLRGTGFETVTIADSTIAEGDISLWGAFDTVTVNSPAALAFREGTIGTLTLNAGSKGTRIHLQSSTLVTQFSTYGAVSVTGTGIITNATEHISGSTFEREPLNYGDEDAATTFIPWINPSANSQSVALDASITVSYSDIMLTKDGEALSADYLQSSSLSLRKDSATTGAFIPCSVYVGEGGKYITLSPNNPWEEDTDYYLGIGEGSLSTKDGLTNKKISSMFSTKEKTIEPISPTVSPTNGKTNVSLDSDIVLDFGEALYSSEGDKLLYSGIVTDYILEGISLRSGSTTGSLVSMDVASLSTTGKIILSPNKDLNPDTRYYLTIDAAHFQNSDGAKNTAFASYFTTEEEEEVLGFTYSISLEDGEEEVPRNVPIILEFASPLCDKDGDRISQENIETYLEDFVTLRQHSSSYFSIAPVLSADGKTLTITPGKPLPISKDFYIAIDENSLFNSKKEGNEAIKLNFTTSDYTLLPTVSPANGAVEVEVDDSIVVSFNEIVYEEDGTYLTTSHLRNEVFTLHEDDEDGDIVDISVSPSGQKVFTITPEDRLDFNRDYCLVIEAWTLSNDNKGTKKNSKMVYTFSTTDVKDLDSPTVSISAMDEDDGSQVISLAFPDSIKKAGGSSISASYLEDYITLREKSATGNSVPFELRISGSKTVYLDIEDTLYPGSDYYVVIDEDSIENSDGQKNEEMKLLLETPAPNFTFTATSVTKSSATLTVSFDYHCEMTFYLDGGKHDMQAIRNHYTPLALTGSLKNSLSGLQSGTTYTYHVTYTSLTGEVTAKEFTFTTPKDN